MTQSRQKGRRRPPPTIIIARGDDIRYFTVRPWMVVLSGTVFVALTVAYLAATAYLVLRDDLIGATMAHQARLQHTYEDRIASLRAQVDRVTSRQMLDQQLIQRQMGELIQRQEHLSERHGRLDSVLQRAEGAVGRRAVPVPTPRPDVRAEADDLHGIDDTVTGSAYAPVRNASVASWPIRGATRPPVEAPTPAPGVERLFTTIDRTLSDIESEQIARVETLAEEAYQTAEAIAEALESAGISVAEGYGEENVGGPLIAGHDAHPDAAFEEKVRDLDEALDRLDTLKQTARRMPIANPLPGAAVTSTFGMRRDPILRRPAHHSGVDFRAARGTPIRAGGPGTVVSAGWNGGYGRMIEIDHGDGLTTRYAHLSRILIAVGDAVGPGTVIGEAGSSGRSTGPHLHYEVRREGTAVNPLKFITAGRRIANLL